MIFRGAVHEIRALAGARGHERQGPRHGVVIQSDRFATSTVTVAMTSTRAGDAVYRPVIELRAVKTRILTDQIFSLSPDRLGNVVGALDPEELADLDRALMMRLGLI